MHESLTKTIWVDTQENFVLLHVLTSGILRQHGGREERFSGKQQTGYFVL